jgi:hypothetical protein
MRKMQLYNILLAALLFVGCSHNSGNVNIELKQFHDKQLERKGFNRQMNSFQFILRNSIENMLSDLSQYRCNVEQDLTLDIAFKSHEGTIDEKEYLNKKKISYKLTYLLHDKNNSYSGEINAIDSFVIPSNGYSYMVSAEDSEIAGINSLIKQLEHDIIHILVNKCK